MRLDHPDYIKLVIAAYHEKLLNNELSPLLAKSTPAGIKKECGTVYQERFDKKDELMLRAFFGPAEQGRKFLALIENFEVDKFRPLDNFLKEGGKKGITDRNIELLAWLIDFKYRPYGFGMEVFLTDKERQILNGQPLEQAIPEITREPLGNSVSETTGKPTDPVPVDPLPPHSPTPPKGWLKKIAAAILSLLIAATGVFFIREQKETTAMPFGAINTGCMYWAGDHYEKISCNEKPKGRLILSFDEDQFDIKKINREDTIGEQHIGKLYYIKHKNDIQYFTKRGKYPEDVNRELQRLSRYIFEKDSSNRILKQITQR